ncbi:hypothetical protein DPMN_183173 [Dreissena polymorpha]|uniref:Uncharacterized protein n=1 Tax=Dreissena polymorpha TaxID=45954 RepID=A0A9D4DH20_DREPO|nr:hypothetical protein DPMN_183173 [Dreissena polymorpha]
MDHKFDFKSDNKKNAPPPPPPDIMGTHLLTKFHYERILNVASRVFTIRSPEITRYYWDKSSDKFHEDWKINETCPPPGSHVFQPTGIIFELIQDIIGMNLLIKFHEDRTVNVASRVKNAPPLGSHVFQANIIIFELIQDIIETNLLTKIHEDLTIK